MTCDPSSVSNSQPTIDLESARTHTVQPYGPSDRPVVSHAETVDPGLECPSEHDFDRCLAVIRVLGMHVIVDAKRGADP